MVEVTEHDISLAQNILSASSRHDVAALRILLKDGSANVKDPATGTAPLHAAIEALAPSDQNGAVDGAERAAHVVDSTKEEEAVKVVKFLLLNGAIWNELNAKNETPGCIALRVGAKDVYEVMVDAGVRAELLFGKLAALGEEMDVDEDEDEDVEIETSNQSNEVTKEEKLNEPSSAQGEQQHAIDLQTQDPDYDVSKDNLAYLKSELRFKPGILLDSSDNAVMMDWEKAIMTRHAETLLNKPGLRAMNVGHGMGIVDTAIQERDPKEHHIVEAHPQVLQKLRENGWYDKPNVRIHEGRWQDVLPKLVEEGVVLDAIYYDTFAEDYAAFREFFSEYVVQLLDSQGKFGWYNGLGADRQISYDVYKKVAEIDLLESGFDTTWEAISVPEDLHGSKQWDGTRRPYWTIDVYLLPVNTFCKLD